MELDIRQPIGLLFTVIGVLLIAQGALVAVPAQGAIAGLNLDIGWGAVMVVFGIAMLMLARRARSRDKAGMRL
jgi:hypothetical protein